MANATILTMAAAAADTAEAVAAMAKKKQEKKGTPEDPTFRNVTENRRARHDFDITAQLECGIVLWGSEVKSLRTGHCNISESYARVKNGELWLINCDIPEYDKAHQFNHQPRRTRKLLVHQRELKKLDKATQSPGTTLIPLQIYFTRGYAKVKLGVCTGRQKHDKRQALKDAEAKRDIRTIMNNRSQRGNRKN
ncbi:MAG: SsrA-binding protein SmpB [Thermoguttaceae bacterium]|nr:SsrA-binding protein SmpB [Thermoguttaceae bacterium]